MKSIRLQKRGRTLFADLTLGTTRWRLAWSLAMDEMLTDLRLSALGPLWLIVQPLLWMLAIIVLIRPSGSAQEPLYPLYVAIGIIFFLAMQSLLTGGARVFARERNRILNVPLPLFVFVLKNVVRAGIELAITMPIVIATMIFFTPSFGAVTLLVLPGILIYFVFGTGATLMLGTLAARFIDVVFLVRSAMRIMLFLTPIFWLPDPDTGPRHLFAQYNPLHHFLAVIRDPLMGQMPEPVNWAVSGVCALAALTAGFAMFARYRDKVPIWI